MNKETRTFIFGLVLFLICGSGVARDIIPLVDGTKFDLLQLFTLICSIVGCLIGYGYIQKTID